MLKHIDAFWKEQSSKISPSTVEKWVMELWPNVIDFKFNPDYSLYTWTSGLGYSCISLSNPPCWFICRCWIELAYPREHVFFEPADGNWFFWDETEAGRVGPYDTEAQAREGLRKYVEQLNAPKTDEIQRCG